MTIVAARRYSGGKIIDAELKLDGTRREALPAHSFDWVGLAEPGEAEMDLVQRQFGLHPLAVEDALNPAQMPKVEVYGPQLFIVARTADMTNGENIEYGQTALFLGRDFIVSVRFGSSRAHSDLRARLESNDQQLAEGPDYVAHAILDFVVDGYIPILEKLESAVLGIEERAIDAFPDPATIRRIFRLRRQLRRFLRVVGPTDEMCEKLVLHDYVPIDPSARVWFRDVLDHVRRALRRVGGLIETLASVVETASMLEQHRQGQMTRQLAAWAAILAVPTAIAGIYGMNFDYMPELHHKWGYPVVLTAIFAICGGLFWRFKRIGWL